MRRREKEILDRGEIDEILIDALVCRIAFARDNDPYLVPLFFGYDGTCIYFHTARRGKKLDFIAANSKVCFEVERNVQVVQKESDACAWSACFESVIGNGTVSELFTEEKKVYGLNQIMLHYSGKTWRFDPSALGDMKVWCVKIETLTGKRSEA